MFKSMTKVLALTCLLIAAMSVIAKDTQTTFEKTVEPDLVMLQPLGAEVASYSMSIRGSRAYFTQEFDGRDTPIITLHDPNGMALPDGLYIYEISSVPHLNDLPRQAAKSLTTAERFEIGRTLPKASRAAGSFRILNGEFVIPTAERVGKTDQIDDTDEGRDQIIGDDLIVQNSLCVGMDCVNGESFGFDTLRLKENNLRIKFQDTSNSGSFPTRDWQLTANDSINGGAEKFSIDDIDGGRTPFTIEASAPSNSLYVDDGGRVGLGTATPVVELHVVDGDTPTLRLEQDGSSGFTPQTWDLASNETNFFVRDATNGSRLPFKIRPSAPTNSLFIDTDGDVALGTQTPDAGYKMDVRGNLQLKGETPKLFVEDTRTTYDNNVHTIAELRSKSPLQMQMTISDSTNLAAWAFKVGTGDFTFKENSSSNNSAAILQVPEGGGLLVRGSTTSETPTDLFEVTSAGNVIAGGTTVHTSDVTVKENLGIVDPMSILARVNELPIARWQYLKDDCAADHIGPMSQDFHELFGLGFNDKGIASVDTAGVALASIQALSQQVEAKDAQIAELISESAALKAESAALKAKSDALEARLAALEKALLKN